MYEKTHTRRVEEIESLRASVDRLRTWEADVQNALRGAMDETCDANERHCTCVPLLRAAVQQLRRACEAVATAYVTPYDSADKLVLAHKAAVEMCQAALAQVAAEAAGGVS